MIIIMVVIAAVFSLILRYTQFGRNVYAIGGVWQSAIGVLFFSVPEVSRNTMVSNAYVLMRLQGLVIVAILYNDRYDNKRCRERV